MNRHVVLSTTGGSYGGEVKTFIVVNYYASFGLENMLVNTVI